MPLADVLLDYWNHHGIKLRSKETVKIQLRYWNDFWKEATVADVRSVNRQEEFQAWLSAKGLKPSSCNRCLEMGRAAIRRAFKRGAISSAPFVQTLKEVHCEPKGKPLSVEELRSFYHGSEERHWRDMVFLLTATAARPEAIMQLEKSQMDFDARLIRLNQNGRPQTNKYRPTVKLTEAVYERFKDYPEGHIIKFHGKPIGRPEVGVRKARHRSGLQDSVTLYSIRHTCARWMRMEGVDTMEIANQLGHRRLGFDMTMRYAPHAPDYLSEAAEALEKLCRAAFF
jgi:integrase